jgi:collagenase-like PrtC family protease
MKLTIPFNGQPDLLDRVNKERVVEVYGKLTADITGGGRPSCASPFVSRNRLAAAVKESHAYGLKFNYALNAACLNNKEHTRKGQKEIRAFLDWLSKIGVDNVTVAIPYLAQIIKKCYPNFGVIVSNIAQVNGVRKAKQWEDLGVDEISIFVSVNRIFPLLKAIRKDVKCRIQVILNQDTLHQCAMHAYHNLLCTHASRSDSSPFFIDYCRLSCCLRRIINPVDLIRAAWIRPEDVHYYEDIGVDIFKLVDRAMVTDAIVNIVEAYTSRRYDGNLFDLLPHYSTNLLASSPNILKKVKYFFRPFAVNIFKLYKAKGVMSDFDGYVDNRLLDGFMEFFLNNNCDSLSCSECGYCSEIAKKAVRINPAYQHNASVLHRELLDQLISGDIFKY